MLKYLKLSFIFVLLFLTSGCKLNLTTITTTTSSVTTNYKHTAIEDEYILLSAQIPYSLIDDIVLPSPTNPLISVEYLVDNKKLDNNSLSYQKLAYDLEINLQIRLQYDDVLINKSFIIIQLRDEILYNQAKIESVFESALAAIQDALPKTIISDFTLPSFNINDVRVRLSVSENYKIVNNRFIYTFPSEQTSFNIYAKVTHQNQSRTYQIPISMTAYDDLPKIPEIHITTQNNAQITSNEDYVSGRLTLKTFDSNNIELSPIANASMQIRLRGNSTLFMPKKPYKIKFTTKTALLSEYAQKDWVLLANFTDQTLIRNYLAYNLGNDIGMEFSPMAKFVDVYINGQYQGNYLLSDQVEVSPNRVNVEEGSSSLDTGYLVEYDYRLYDYNLSTISDNYFILYGIPFVIKSPNQYDSNYSIYQKYFIEDYLKTVYDTLKNKNDYSHLIDDSTFIDWFIVEEVFKNVDSGYSSVFMYKDKNGLLKMGPVWDFDLSTGNQGHEKDPNMRGPEGWYTSLDYKNIFYYYLMQYPSFRQKLKIRWNEIYELHLITLLDKIYQASDSITRSRYDNFVLWDIIGKNNDWYTAPEVLNITTYEGQVQFLYSYLNERLNWLNEEINNF